MFAIFWSRPSLPSKPTISAHRRTALLTASLLSLVFAIGASDVRADGGNGGGHPSSGGSDSIVGAGAAGTNDNITGGGGGGAGATGGDGGGSPLSGGAAPGGSGAAGNGLNAVNSGNGGGGGAHGGVTVALPVAASTGGTGGAGAAGIPFDGGGGGGGGFGAVVTGNGLSGIAGFTVTGGNGGDGGNGGTGNSRGGFAGAGGAGLLFTGTGHAVTIGALVAAGSGGNGGSGRGFLGAGSLAGGNGGNGGIGLSASTSSFTINAAVLGGAGGTGGAGGFNNPNQINNVGGTGGSGGAAIAGSNLSLLFNAGIAGGNGGAGGAGVNGPATNGANGVGAAAVIGSGLSLVSNSTIVGGLGGDGITRANAITFTGGSNVMTFGNAASGVTGNISVTGSLTFAQPADSALTQAITGTGSIAKTGAGVLSLSGTNTYSGGTTITAGKLAVTDDANLGNVAGGLIFNGGTLRTSTGGGPTVAIARAVTLQTGRGTVETTIATILGGNIDGAGGLTKTGTALLSLSGTNNYTGATNVTSGQLQSDSAGAFSASSAFTVAAGAVIELRGLNQTIGSLAGAGEVRNFNVAAAVLTTGADNTSTTFSGIISGANGTLSLTKVGTGTQTLSGINTYIGATTISGGTLAVNGSIASSSLTTVNAGGTLGGTGTVGNTTINGGALAPGNSIGTLSVAGNLVFTAAASYMIEVSPASADRTNVTGMATLGGATVKASFAAGTYVARQYTIINAAGGVSGTFSSLVNTNLPGGFTPTVSYDANNAYLNLALNFTPTPAPNFGGGLTGNQQAVGNALISFFNTTGGIPLVFGTLTPAGLTQLSGETATGSQQTTFNAMNQFMGVMTDPFIAGRGDPIGAGGSPSAFADEATLAYAARRKPNDALAAIYTKAPPIAQSFEQRWSVWAAAYGGSQTTDGNTVIGSSNARSSVYGIVAGADYRLSPNTIAGFALAGGGTNFSVNGFGSGRSDLFQAGAFIRHTIGAAYLSGALAYGWQDITTDRTVTVAGIDRLRAQFNANAWSGRVEGGYRFVAQGLGITPYAAGQFTTFELPNYAEQAIVGANTFALAYNSRSVTDTRSELGLRTDKSFPMPNGILTLRGRAAWAHDFNPDRSVAATFQTLPGASFVVNGARQAADAALVTGSAEMKWINGWSTAATFEGEFSNVTRSYAGKGVVRYAW